MNHKSYLPSNEALHKDFSFKERVRYMTINSFDKSVTSYKSSCDFIYKLPDQLAGDSKNIDHVSLFSGVIPNIFTIAGVQVCPYLYLSINELDGQLYNNSIGTANALLEYGFESVDTGLFLKLVWNDELINVPNNKGKLDTMTIKILNPSGAVYDFTNSVYTVTATVAGATTTFTIGAHIFAPGDRVYVRNFPNASSKSLKDTIESYDSYVIAATAANTITLPINTTGEAANQPTTGTEPAYGLGQGTQLYDESNGANFSYIIGVSTFSTANPTTFNTGGLPHGFNNGDTVLIKGFSNGTSSYINSLMNNRHIITVTGANTFTIPVDLSTQAATQQRTGSSPAFGLGVGTKILAYTRQVSFQLKFIIKPTDRPGL